MSTYSQQNIKRQKTTRELLRPVESVDYFPGIPKIEYKTNTQLLDDTLCYRFYNALERVHGKTMEEWIRPAVSLTAFKYNGEDSFGKPTYQRSWDDQSNSVENHKRCLKACLEFCNKLGVKHWSAYDHDLYPSFENIDQNLQHSEEIVDYVLELQQHNQLKPLWIAPDLHKDIKYASGAITINEANIFIAASQQTKRALEIAQKLNAESFLIWTAREGHMSPLNTDVPRELKQCSRFLKMISNYKETISFRGQLLIDSSHHKRETNQCYHSCDQRNYEKGYNCNYFQNYSDTLCFLKHYNLDRCFKLSVWPGYQLTMANLYNIVGCVELCHDNFSVKDATILMKTVIDQGGFMPGGININITPSRDSVDIQDLYISYISIIDTLAKGLRIAAKMCAGQTFTKIVQQRYSSFSTGYGSRLSNSDLTFEDCEELMRKLQGQASVSIASAKREHCEWLLQRYIDSV